VVSLVQASDYRWRELFERADVMSEGATRDEPDGSTYYGTTSILLLSESCGGQLRDSDVATAVGAAQFDPHARVRAIRIACLEAQLRAGSPLDTIHADLLVSREARGIRVDVEIEARIVAEAGRREHTSRR
jgi:hypothetical protein